MSNEIEGVDELKELLDEIGKLPQKCVTKASRRGAMILLRAIKAKAPVETGQLKSGIIITGEKRRKGNKIYQIVFSEHLNDVFVKYSKDGKRAYYPASQEYGFITRDGGYIPGYRFMRDTADRVNGQVKSTILEVLTSELDKLR